MSKWRKEDIANYPRLTDNSENAIAVRVLACRAYQNYMPDHEWDSVNPMVRDHWCMITSEILKAQGRKA